MVALRAAFSRWWSSPSGERELPGAAALRYFLRREDVSFIVHCLFLLALLTVVRPMFSAPVSAQTYEATSVVWELVVRDYEALIRAAKRQDPAMPRLLWLVVPTVALALSRRHVRWTNWEAGNSLRNLVMTIAVIMAWAASTFDYHMYLDRGHAFDRMLVVALAALAFRYPLAIPPLTALIIIMLREAMVPVRLDDFDWRPVGEVLIVFSCFVWASFKRSVDTKHFLVLGLGALASYYYAAGYVKLFYGPRTLSWLEDNHLSNLFVTSYVWGWLSFIPEGVMLAVGGFVRRFDYALGVFTLVVELGAVLYVAHPRITRLWLWGVVLLHLGIFAFSGVFFWKWIVADVAFWLFLRRGGDAILRRIWQHKSVVLFSVALIVLSRDRVYYFPQTGVAWYDTSFVELYHLVAVGESGQRYLIDPSTVAPMEMRITQGHLCTVTNERFFTAVYGTTGNLRLHQAFEDFQTREEVERYIERNGSSCYKAKHAATIEQLLPRYFGNINRAGGKRHTWLRWINRPTHLWIFERPQPWPEPLPLFEAQERTTAIQFWRERVWHHDGQIHRFGVKQIYEHAIP